MSINRIEISDLLAVASLILGMQNLKENEMQSDQQVRMLKQNDVSSANDKQAQYLLSEINRKFEEQNEMLRKILSILEETGHERN